MRKILGLMAAMSVLAATVFGMAPSASAATPSTLVWSDEFSGSSGSAPSAANWTSVPGSTGGAEVQCYTNSRSNSSLDGAGNLIITALSQPNYGCSGGAKENYTSARITTLNSASAQYGRAVMRAKMPTGAGAFPAFWAMGSNIASKPWPANGEIDVAEVGGGDASVVHAGVHGPVAGTGADYTVSRSTDTNVDLSAAYHIYGMTWTSTSLSFDVDGVTYSTITKAQYTASGNTWVFDHPFFLILNVAVSSGDWTGTPSAASPWPQKMTVDYVRFYQ
jgi:beta-glucanase (GH16 family)